MTLTVAAALLGAGPRGVLLAHEGTDAPARTPEEAPHPAPAATASAGSSRVLRWQLGVIGVGALMTAGGGWLLYDETHASASSCAGGAGTRASCTSASVGPGAGLALLMVGAQVTLGGLIWLAIVRPGRRAPVTMGLGPGSLTLRGSF
jgi:hypothetical protein